MISWYWSLRDCREPSRELFERYCSEHTGAIANKAHNAWKNTQVHEVLLGLSPLTSYSSRLEFVFIRNFLRCRKVSPPSLYSRVQWTPAAVGPGCTSPPPAAPPAETPWSTDAPAPHGKHPAPGPDLPERSAPDGAEGHQHHHLGNYASSTRYYYFY